MRTSRLLSTALALALIAGACSDDTAPRSSTTGRADSTEPGTEIRLDPTDIRLASGLAAFDDCDALLSHLRTEGAERVGPYGLDQGGWWGRGIPVDAVGMEDDAMVDTDIASGEPSVAPLGRAARDGEEGVDFSGTNNQERGVDEPDIVKTDGDRILIITNGRFVYVDANDGDPVKRGTIDVGHGATDMVVDGDRVLIFGSTGWYGGPFPGPMPMPGMVDDIAIDNTAIDDIAIDVDPAEEVGEDAEAQFAEDPDGIDASDDELFPTEPYYDVPQSRIVQLDISDPDDPTQLGELLVEGRHLSARLIDGVARIAIQSNPASLPFVYPSGHSSEDRAEEFNRQVVEESTISDWLPDYTFLVEGEERSQGQLSNCADVHAPEEFSGFGSLSVLSLDLDEPLDSVASTSVLATGETVYASTDTMWLATTTWVDWASVDDEELRDMQNSFSTQLHGFDITGASADYLASGNVRGHLLNQFSMSEHDDVLRVATTDGPAWGATQQSESYITTFDVDGTELRRLGEVGNMGKGERIFAVRFVGEIAYVVTFRQTDPFYTVDLSDPANPVVLGELKINGYSGQLHPIGPNRVLGIGQDATAEGRTTGAKVTVFDVTDLANPTALDSWTLPDSWTDAEWSHLAFLWWAPENLAVIPVSSWQQSFWGAVAFHIDPDTGAITEAGRVAHDPDGSRPVGTTGCRVVDAADLEAYREGRGELADLAEEVFWFEEEGGQVQLCGDDETGAAGMFCERVDWIDPAQIGAAGTFEVCWPNGPQTEPIQRTLVTDGDILWSISTNRLQANDLDTFDVRSKLGL